MMGRRADDDKRGEWIELLRRREESGLTVALVPDAIHAVEYSVGR